MSQDPYAGAHQHEREQRADVDPGPEQLQRQQPGCEAYRDAGVDRGEVGRAEPRVDSAGPGPEQAVARHRVEDARLAEQHDENHGADAQDRAEIDREANPPGSADPLHRVRHRSREVELTVGDYAHQHGRHPDVQQRANREGAEDAERHVALGVLRLLRRSRDRVEPDVGEKHQARTPQHAGPAVAAPLPGVRGDERRPVGRPDVRQADEHDQQNDADFENDDQAVDPRRLFDPDDQHGGHQRDDADGWKVDNGTGQVQPRVGASDYVRV